MTSPTTGEVTSSQISMSTNGSPSGSVSLISAPSRFVAEKDSGDIAYSDFRGKAWRQGVGSPLPVGVDVRKEGYYSAETYTDNRTGYWYVRQYMNEFYNGEYKGSINLNSYFYSEPGDLYYSGRFEAGYTDKYSGRAKYGFLYIWAYQYGYLSGDRVQLVDQQRDFGAKTYSRQKFTVPAGYPYVVCNFGTWADGKNTVTPGQEITVYAKFENMKIET